MKRKGHTEEQIIAILKEHEGLESENAKLKKLWRMPCSTTRH
jgi:hypothetical protein